MAGHSHWANIAHKKGKQDKKKGALFTKLSKAIIAACKRSGGDPDTNLALRYALDKARKSSMPRDNIDRAIKKGTGESAGDIYENLLYEGYGPGGVAVICDILTENRNRTAPEVRKIFEYHGGNLGTSGSVAWMFERKGMFLIPATGHTEDQLMEIVLEAGADDLSLQDENFQVLCAVDQFDSVNKALDAVGINTTLAEVTRVPQNTVELNAENAAEVFELLEELEEHEDIQNVTANFSVSAEIMANYNNEE